MKSFIQFLSESRESQAAMQAKKLGLKGDGHGSWIDRSGKTVARTEKGKLKFIDGRQAKSPEENAAATTQAAAPTAQSQVAQAPVSAAQQEPGELLQDSSSSYLHDSLFSLLYTHRPRVCYGKERGYRDSGLTPHTIDGRFRDYDRPCSCHTDP